MMGAISGAMMPMQSGFGQNGGASLTEEQMQLVSDTLEQFDVENLTAADAQSIVAIFEEAGIQPGQALQEAMAASGFDARTVGEMAGVGPSGPPPGGGKGGGMPPSEESIQSTLLEMLDAEDLASILDEEGNIDFEELKNLLIENQSENDAGMLFNVEA